MHGNLGRDTSPFMLIFVLINLFVLSNVEHKEQRFMTLVFPIFALFWAYFVSAIYSMVPQNSYMLRSLFKCIIFVYVSVESFEQIRNHQSYHRGDKELYTMMHGRSNVLLDYSNYKDVDD